MINNIKYGLAWVNFQMGNYEEAYDWLAGAGTEQSKIDAIMNTGIPIYDYLCEEAKKIYSRGFEIYLTEPINEESRENRRFFCVNQERFNPINFGIDYHKDGYDGVACFHYENGGWGFSLYNDNRHKPSQAEIRCFPDLRYPGLIIECLPLIHL